jgi:hypothetical protein
MYIVLIMEEVGTEKSQFLFLELRPELIMIIRQEHGLNKLLLICIKMILKLTQEL